MVREPKYYLVEASALPEIFLKVAETKRLLETGEASTVADATQMTGLSRSAFYKYRDRIMPFQNLMTGRVLTYQLVFHDEPDGLSTIVNIFTQYGANILTISQSIPTGGCATVTITARTNRLKASPESMLCTLKTAPGIIRAEVLAG